MPEKVMPGPVSDLAGIREAVCVHTQKIMDACRDKDCVEDLRVYLTCASQQVLERAVSVKPGCAELLYVSPIVEPICFNKGFYTVDVRYFYRINADAFVGAARPVAISGLAVFDKRVILFGSESGSKTFTSDMPACPDLQNLPQTNAPTAVVEAVDPMVLGLKMVDHCDCNCQCELSEIPASICSAFTADLDFGSGGKRLYVSLGQFSLIRLERDTQLLMPVYDYCIPDKECPCDGPSCEEDPCELFRHVQFPVSEFFPQGRDSAESGSSCGCCNS